MSYEHINLPISALLPYANNARTHSDDQVSQIAASIKEFGFTNPILVNEDNGVIAGHGRIAAAERAGIDEVPCVVLSGLSEDQQKAYVIADNQLALNAGWDPEILMSEISDLEVAGFDVSLLGVDLDAFVLPDFSEASEEDQGSLDSLEPKIVNCPHCGESFDARNC